MVVSLAISGCGTGSYEARMEDSLKELRMKSPFLEHLDQRVFEVTDAQGNNLGVFLQLPRYVQKDASQSYQDGTGYPGFRTGSKTKDGGTIEERRVPPPFLKLRDFCLSYEWFVRVQPGDWNNPEQPVYVYFAVSDAKSIEQQALLDEIQRGLADAISIGGAEEASSDAAAGDDEDGAGDSTEIPLQWEAFPVRTPTGGTLPVRGMRIDSRILEGQNLLSGVEIQPDDLQGTLRSQLTAEDGTRSLRAGPGADQDIDPAPDLR